MDTRSGLIAYVVLDADEVLEGTRKQVAIDLSAFDANENLRLNVDKSQLARTHSFGKNDWPAIASETNKVFLTQ